MNFIVMRGDDSNPDNGRGTYGGAGRYSNEGFDNRTKGYIYAEDFRDALGNNRAGIDVAEAVHIETLPDTPRGTINETN